MEPRANSKYIAIGIVIAVLIIGGCVWYFWYRGKATEPAPASPNAPASASSSVSGGLGVEVYQKVSNPVGDKLPAPVSPAPNPIQGAYKNPFQ